MILYLHRSAQPAAGGLNFNTYDNEEVIKKATVMDLDSDLEGITTLMVRRAHPSDLFPSP